MSRVNTEKRLGMQKVRPFRGEEELDRCWAVCRQHDQQYDRPDMRWEMLWLLGINVGLRISDLTRLRVKDVRAPKGWMIRLRAKKTGKELGDGEGQPIPKSIRPDMIRLTEGRDLDEWLFQSRQKDRYSGEKRAISRQRAWEIVNEIARGAGVEGHIGCHSLRKTFGKRYYDKYHDIVALQGVFGHSSAEVTKKYIGVTTEQTNKRLEDL